MRPFRLPTRGAYHTNAVPEERHTRESYSKAAHEARKLKYHVDAAKQENDRIRFALHHTARSTIN